MSPLDLIRSRDGSMSLTKLAAATFHLAIACAVISITAVKVWRYVETPTAGFDVNLFDLATWGLWASVAVGHAVADKTGAQVAAFKNKKLDAETGNSGLGGLR